MMMIAGIIIVIATVYFLVKQYDARFVLLASGIIMACIGGVPMSSLDAFAKSMTNGGLIQAGLFCHGVCPGHEIYAMR